MLLKVKIHLSPRPEKHFANTDLSKWNEKLKAGREESCTNTIAIWERYESLRPQGNCKIPLLKSGGELVIFCNNLKVFPAYMLDLELIL